MESKDTVSKVVKPNFNAWVNNIVVVEKPDGDIRICVDPQNLNRHIIRNYKRIPHLDEIRTKTKNKKFRFVFDLKDGFHHLPLTQAGKDKCCFSTEYGVYKFNVLPFGVANAAEDFQNEAEKIFGGIEGVTIYSCELT
jgi:hypothetical protein